MVPAPPSPRIRIAGVGLVSPLGLGAWPTFRALLEGRTLADRAARLPADLDPVTFHQQVGRVGVAAHGGDDPAVVLAELAAREAAMEAGADLTAMRCCIGTSKGAVHALTGGGCFSTRSAPRSAPRSATRSAARSAPRSAAPSALHESLALGPHGHLTHRLRQRLQLGLTEHYVAACASSLTALHHARLKMLRPGGPDTILVVTSEAALLPLFIHSYRRLGVLAPPAPGRCHSGPLDESRRGFMLSELAAAVVLRRTGTVEPGQVELLDTAIACDAHDLIRTDPAMPALRHIAARLLTGPMVVHPHATGTADHDPAEIAAISNVESRISNLYAVKGALGHGLGASGLVSLVVACLCARAGQRPPMPWLHRPIHPSAIPHPPSAMPPLPHAVFAAGFAGHVAGAVISKR